MQVTVYYVSLVVRPVFRWMLCVLVGCCDYASDGPSHVNAASKHDGPPDTTDEPPFAGHHGNGELQRLFPLVSLDFIRKRQHFLFLPPTSAGWILHHWGTRLLGPSMNKPHSACTVLGHMYSHWQGWRVYFAAFKSDFQKVLMMPCPRNVCFRPCNWIHWSVVFLSQMFMISAHNSPRLFPRGQPTLIIANNRAFYLLSMFMATKCNWEPHIIDIL